MKACRRRSAPFPSMLLAWMLLPAAAWAAGGDGVRIPGHAAGAIASAVQVAPQCSDGADNDGDGLTDFPADPDCNSMVDDDESPPAPTDLGTQRALLVVATAGTLNGDACAGVFTGGDGGDLCSGSDVSCMVCNTLDGDCGNLLPDDSRLYKLKGGLVLPFARTDVEFGLMRAHQTPRTFACPGADALGGSGGWQGAPSVACDQGYNSGDVLVSFASDNRPALAAYVDNEATYPGGGVPASGADAELRGSGARPLAGLLQTAKLYLDVVRDNDPASGCRPYEVLLVADGASTCPGDAVAAASALAASGAKVYVFGFAASAPADIAALNAIGSAGGTEAAYFVDDSAELSTAIGQILGANVLVELCNGIDDDCDGAVDEGFGVGEACTNGMLGACLRTGTRQCALDGLSSVCDAPAVAPQEEICGNAIDDDCDGYVDETCDAIFASGFE